jgi:hypothetical protein
MMLPVIQGWAYTGSPIHTGRAVDLCWYRPWWSNPFRDAVMCLDAPEYLPTTRRIVAGGIIMPQYDKRP